jgi:hypothetical protein
VSTIADMKRLLQPYVDRHDDLALVGRAVIIKPVRHIMRGFFVDRMSMKTSLQPFWFVSLMYVPWQTRQSMGFDWTGRNLVRHTNLEDEATQADIFQAMDISFDELRGILDRSSAFGIKLESFRKLENFPIYRGLVQAAEGDFERAVEDLSMYVAREEASMRDQSDFIEKHTRPHGRPRQKELASLERLNTYVSAIKALVALLKARDRQGIATLLREWERGTAAAWEIEHLWEPTPFPFESGA